MLPQLLILAGVLAALWLLRGWLRRTRPAMAAKMMRTVLLGLLVLAGLWLVLTGKLAGLFAVLAGASPWISRVLRAHGIWKSVRGAMGAKRPADPPRTGMSVEEAREILGVGANASADEIRAAHRRLMLANHPDHGGSTWIAARINQARDLLLG
ncbi:MAG: DnaJ domain-containing protein [Bacteroidales bacterium]